MRRFPLLGILMLIPAFSLVFLVGCPAPDAKDKDKKPAVPVTGDGKVKDKKKGGGGAGVEMTADTDGTIKGVIKFKGKEPELKPLDAMAKHGDGKTCMAAPLMQKVSQEWLIKDGKVSNVVVSLAPPAGKKYKITDALKEPFKQPVIMDQPFCAYIPHVVAVYAEIQPFIVKNSADVLHNVKIVGNKNTPSDDSLPPKTGATPARKYEKESAPLNISCSVHGFMTAKLLTFDHPYFAVSKEDGSFEIKNAPIGEELTIWLWHEATDKIESQKITLKKGDNSVELEIGPKAN